MLYHFQFVLYIDFFTKMFCSFAKTFYFFLCVFIIACFRLIEFFVFVFLLMAALTPLSDNVNICALSFMAFVDCLFSFKLRFFWLLVQSDFQLYPGHFRYYVTMNMI